MSEVLTWRGRPLDELSRDELCLAIGRLYRELQQERECRAFSSDTFRRFRAAAPMGASRVIDAIKGL